MRTSPFTYPGVVVMEIVKPTGGDRELVTIEETPTTVSHHPHEGTLFYIASNETVGEVEHIHYETLDNNLDALEDIQKALRGEDSIAFHHALVRRGVPNGWKYYPLPLVYASESERVIAAEQFGNRPPPGRWIRRRQLAVDKLLTEKLSAV